MKPKRKVIGALVALGIAALIDVLDILHSIFFMVKQTNVPIDEVEKSQYNVLLIVGTSCLLLFTAAHVFATIVIFYKQKHSRVTVITQISAGIYYLMGVVCAVISPIFTPMETALLLIIANSVCVISAVVSCFVCKEAKLI